LEDWTTPPYLWQCIAVSFDGLLQPQNLEDKDCDEEEESYCSIVEAEVFEKRVVVIEIPWAFVVGSCF
jgi:hypothetical protein